jgi:cellulose synthase/poly-beta-1,6-N-acetylglucosamine synthase-like glycosyltransferase
MMSVFYTLEPLLVAAFWVSIGAVVYTYLGYPLLALTLAKLRTRPPLPPKPPTSAPASSSPRVALIIAAHNEADVIEHRVRNALALNYPPENLQIVIASDGSGDGTAEIARRTDDRITVLAFPVRRGKACTLNDAVAATDADVLVFSDANTTMDQHAIRHLVRWFADDQVGVVCGRLVVTKGPSDRNMDGAYWSFETSLKAAESRLGGLLGANGAIYAMRRSLFSPLAPDTIVDDFVAPLTARLRTGCRILFDPDATAHEAAAPSIADEFRRRVRIGMGAWQSLRVLWPLLSPAWGWTAVALWSHKIMRWACPLFMLKALATSVLLSHRPLFAAAAGAQLLAITVCLIALALPGRARLPRPVRLGAMFAAMNAALLIGLIRYLSGPSTGIWKRTPRTAP